MRSFQLLDLPTLFRFAWLGGVWILLDPEIVTAHLTKKTSSILLSRFFFNSLSLFFNNPTTIMVIEDLIVNSFYDYSLTITCHTFECYRFGKTLVCEGNTCTKSLLNPKSERSMIVSNGSRKPLKVGWIRSGVYCLCWYIFLLFLQRVNPFQRNYEMLAMKCARIYPLTKLKQVRTFA